MHARLSMLRTSLSDIAPLKPDELTTDHAEGVDLDDLARAGTDELPEFHSIDHLIAVRRQAGGLDEFKRKVTAMKEQAPATLIARLKTTHDPLIQWALHVALDGRGIAPVFRCPAPAKSSDTQAAFIAWQADMQWLCKRYPAHVPKGSTQRLWAQAPGSAQWKDTAYAIYSSVSTRQSVAHYLGVRRLALTDAQRQETLMLPTAKMERHRAELHGDGEAALRQALFSDAMANRDKSGQRTPEQVASRRFDIWRTYRLSGESLTATRRNWQLLTGETVSRPAIQKQIDAVQRAQKDWG